MPGFDSVACGSSVLGSGAGEGTSICGCWSAFGGSACFGRSAQRAPRKTTSSTASSPITSFAAGLPPGPRAPGPATPGMAGISDLKRSDGGWSGISFVPILYTNRSKLTTDCPESTEKGNVTSGPDVKTETNEDDLARSTASAPLAFQRPKSPPSKTEGGDFDFSSIISLRPFRHFPLLPVSDPCFPTRNSYLSNPQLLNALPLHSN